MVKANPNNANVDAQKKKRVYQKKTIAKPDAPAPVINPAQQQQAPANKKKAVKPKVAKNNNRSHEIKLNE